MTAGFGFDSFLPEGASTGFFDVASGNLLFPLDSERAVDVFGFEEADDVREEAFLEPSFACLICFGRFEASFDFGLLTVGEEGGSASSEGLSVGFVGTVSTFLRFLGGPAEAFGAGFDDFTGRESDSESASESESEPSAAVARTVAPAAESFAFFSALAAIPFALAAFAFARFSLREAILAF